MFRRVAEHGGQVGKSRLVIVLCVEQKQLRLGEIDIGKAQIEVLL